MCIDSKCETSFSAEYFSLYTLIRFEQYLGDRQALNHLQLKTVGKD